MYQNPNQKFLDKCAGKVVSGIKYRFSDEIRITFTDGSFINLIAQSVSMPEYRIDISLKEDLKEENV